MQTTRLAQLIAEGAQRLRQVSPIADQEARWIVEHSLLHQERAELNFRVETLIKERLDRRASGIPLQYVLESQEFLDHTFRVTPSVLIPRPETEYWVSLLVQELKSLGFCRGLEIGLGSGVISISLLAALPDLVMKATEISKSAQAVAMENAAAILGKDFSNRLEIMDIDQPLTVIPSNIPSNIPSEIPGQIQSKVVSSEKFDFIVSNPPYLVDGEAETSVVTSEPHQALFAPTHAPLHFYQEIAEHGGDLLSERGQIWVEIPHERAALIQDLFESRGWFAQLVQDLTDRPRLLRARRNAWTA